MVPRQPIDDGPEVIDPDNESMQTDEDDRIKILDPLENNNNVIELYDD